MSDLEAKIEKKCVKLADSLGWMSVKLDKAARHWPDRCFFIREGVIVLVEFKRPGLVPRAGQDEIFNALRALAHPVHMIDNVQKFKELLTRYHCPDQ